MVKSNYYINYGKGNFHINCTLNEAIDYARLGAIYTQNDIEIYDENNIIIAQWTWFDEPIDKKAKSMYDYIDFYSFGHYLLETEKEF